MIYHNNALQNYQPDKQPDYQLRADSSSIRREAPTSNIARLAAARVHPENPRESLDVPHIRRKLKVRRYEGHFSEQKARASRDANLAAMIASDWFNTTKKKSCCQRPVVETFAGGAEADTADVDADTGAAADAADDAADDAASDAADAAAAAAVATATCGEAIRLALGGRPRS